MWRKVYLSPSMLSHIIKGGINVFGEISKKKLFFMIAWIKDTLICRNKEVKASTNDRLYICSPSYKIGTVQFVGHLSIQSESRTFMVYVLVTVLLDHLTGLLGRPMVESVLQTLLALVAMTTNKTESAIFPTYSRYPLERYKRPWGDLGDIYTRSRRHLDRV